MAAEIVKALKKLVPHLLQAKTDNLNEADTSQRVTKVLEDVLGYDPLTEISFETQLKNKYVDIALKIDGTIRLLVEVKAAGVTLRDRHIEQAEGYASRNNFQWVLLTNGVAWHLYHLTFEEGIEYDRAFVLDLEKDDPETAAELLGVLHRNAIRRGELDDFWQRKAALSTETIGKCVFGEEVLMLIRREIRREAGILIDVEDLAAAIHAMLSIEAREAIGPARVRKRRSKARAQPEKSEPPPEKKPVAPPARPAPESPQ